MKLAWMGKERWEGGGLVDWGGGGCGVSGEAERRGGGEEMMLRVSNSLVVSGMELEIKNKNK